MIMRYMWLLVLVCSMISAGQSHLRVIVPSYNNARWYEKNLQSIFDQSDQNYELYYIDDASTDGTGDLVEAYVRKYGKEDQVHIIRNECNRGALANIYSIVHQCPDDAIIILIDGDDWLYDNQVFFRINTAYQDANVWMTYGQFIQSPGKAVGFCRNMPEDVIRHNAYREYDWITSHLRTFYAGLFKRIKLQDLLDEQGKFFGVTWDMAFMFPMLEMAGKHVRFISDVQYVYNQANPLNDFRKKFIEQVHCDRLIRSRSKYSAIERVLDARTKKMPSICSVALYSSDTHKVQVIADNIQTYMRGIKESHVVTLDTRDGLERLKNMIHETSCEYVLLFEESSKISFDIDLLHCARELERTQAFAFYFNIMHVGAGLCTSGWERPAGQFMGSNIFAWQFKNGSFGWRMPYQFGGALYRKRDIQALLAYANQATIRTFFFVMNLQRLDTNIVGLCFDVV